MDHGQEISKCVVTHTPPRFCIRMDIKIDDEGEPSLEAFGLRERAARVIDENLRALTSLPFGDNGMISGLRHVHSAWNLYGDTPHVIGYFEGTEQPCGEISIVVS